MSTSHLHQYAHVLVAYDGSTAATAALQWARVLTRRLVARLTIVIVQEPGQPPTRLAPLSQPPARAGLREVHVVTNGTPWRRLLIEASARDVDLIVIGKRGDSQQTARRVGRNSARVATRALVPTLLVPRGSEVPAETPHILLATDLLGGIAHGAAGIAMLARAVAQVGST